MEEKRERKLLDCARLREVLTGGLSSSTRRRTVLYRCGLPRRLVLVCIVTATSGVPAMVTE
jgi:hypothetical protein